MHRLIGLVTIVSAVAMVALIGACQSADRKLSPARLKLREQARACAKVSVEAKALINDPARARLFVKHDDPTALATANARVDAALEKVGECYDKLRAESQAEYVRSCEGVLDRYTCERQAEEIIARADAG